jgi:hypothetical protein
LECGGLLPRWPRSGAGELQSSVRPPHSKAAPLVEELENFHMGLTALSGALEAKKRNTSDHVEQ